eukprot:Pgem_evm1s5067
MNFVLTILVMIMIQLMFGEEENRKNDCKGRTCCTRHVLKSQPDFREQKSIIEELIPRYGHKVQNLPKFHCELNPIEMLWGTAKRYSRRECDYTTAGLRATIPDALESVLENT